MLNRSAQTGPPNARKRRLVFPPTGWSVVLCTPQMAPRTSFLSRQPDVIASFFVWHVYCADMFSTISRFLKEICALWRIFNLIREEFSVEYLFTYQAWIVILKSAGNAP